MIQKTLLTFAFALFSLHFLQPSYAQSKYQLIQKGEQTYLSNTVVIKYKQSYQSNINQDTSVPKIINNYFNESDALSHKPMFAKLHSRAESELDRVYILEYSSNIDPQILSSKLSRQAEVEWAEPKYVYMIDYIPNDPFYSSQYALQKTKAADAWNITTADTSIVIAIIDTGVDWDHPDLAANIWKNWDEIPANGVDDDFNGFVDDIRGWDFGGLTGTPDNNPTEDRPDHGTHVAGDAGAVTDNLIGVASVGFKCKIMPVKTTRDDYRNISNLPYVIFGYEGIKYAAENGAKIINCSWGGGGFSILGQEIINYATSLGALVVAAAGNNNSSAPFYPSAYNNVLSVAATDESDIKASFSNYGPWVDVSAPGVNIYSTWQNDSYTYGNGTSFSSPITAGLAGLVRSQFPLFTPNQIAEQIRSSCDIINSVNPGFVNQLGKGRINAFDAVSNTALKSVRANDVFFADELPGGNGNGVLEAGETIKVRCTFTNYLSPTSNLNIYLESINNFSTVLQGIFNPGALSTLDIFHNTFNEFTFQLNTNIPSNTVLNFNLNYVDGTYQDIQVIQAIANPTYATQAGNNVALTLTSKGVLGFNDYPSNLQGDGFKYMDGINHLFEGALILATSSSHVSDCARNRSTQNSDFVSTQPLLLKTPGTTANVEGSCSFNDDNAGANKLGLDVKLNSFSFDNIEDQNYILLRYDITSNTQTTISNLFAGLFFDWDLIDGSDDFTAYDSLYNFAYSYHIGGNPDTWVAAALISSENYGFWAINNAGGDGGFSIYDGFSDEEKWQSVSSGIGKRQAGAGDVSNVVSGGPFLIESNDTLRVAFAVAAGFSLEELRTAVSNARTKYSQIPTSIFVNDDIYPNNFYLSQNFPNPFNPSTRIRFAIAQNIKSQLSKVTLKIYDVLGNEVTTLLDEYRPAGNYEIEFKNMGTLPSGVYFYRLHAGDFVESKKCIMIK
ncbi:MAG: S8 family serine peptidase [Ignavibacteriaceae bacterium]|nr:S8 family serine peptidase [Ignavibacteriaceae bacterium]